MEKLLEELIERLENKKIEILHQLKNNPADVNDKVSLLLSGEALAYDSFIKELHRLIAYARECK